MTPLAPLLLSHLALSPLSSRLSAASLPTPKQPARCSITAFQSPFRIRERIGNLAQQINEMVEDVDAELADSVEHASPPTLSEEVCLVPGLPVVRVEAAPGNARRIFTGIDIVAECEDVCSIVWSLLTDYESLPKAVPNLVENEIVERLDNGGARLRQVGGAKLAPMVTFKATTTLDVRLYEEGLPTEMEQEHLSLEDADDDVREASMGLPLKWDVFPRPFCITSLPHRDITMQGVPDLGDFRFYQGVWRMQNLPACAPPGSSAMRLTYSVELSPRAWVPVALLEGQIASSLGDNLVSIRNYVQQPSVLRAYEDRRAVA